LAGQTLIVKDIYKKLIKLFECKDKKLLREEREDD
jgi:hypothetical protein